MQRERENYYRQKVEQIVTQMVGATNLRVQVSAAMSFDRVERTVASVDPDKQAVAAEQKADITPGAQGGAAQNNTSTTYENTRSTENFVAAPGTVKRLTVAVLVADRAPASNSKNAKAIPRTAAELEMIRTMVRGAVGADSIRGDVVSVVSVPFAQTTVAPVEAAKTDIIKVVQTASRPVLGILGLVLIIVVMLISLKSIKGGGGAPGDMISLPRGAGASQVALQPPVAMPIMPTNTMRDRVNSTIEQQPDAAARVVRAWLKEA
jgi:flagellar M-ring protein FliF